MTVTAEGGSTGTTTAAGGGAGSAGDGVAGGGSGGEEAGEGLGGGMVGVEGMGGIKLLCVRGDGWGGGLRRRLCIHIYDWDTGGVHQRGRKSLEAEGRKGERSGSGYIIHIIYHAFHVYFLFVTHDTGGNLFPHV